MNGQWIITRRRYVPAVLSILDYFSSWSIPQTFGLHPQKIIRLWDKGWIYAIWHKQVMEKFGEYFLDLAKQRDLDLIRQEAQEAGEALVLLCQEFAQKCAALSLEDFVAFYKDVAQACGKVIEKSAMYWFFIDPIVEQKIDYLLSNYSLEDKQKILSIMLLPTQDSYIQEQEKSFHNLVALARDKGVDDTLVTQEVDSFLEKYFWVPYEYVGPDVWTHECVMKRLQEALMQEQKTYSSFHIAQEQEECITRFNLSLEHVTLFTIARAMSLLQDDRKGYNAQACYYLNDVVAKTLAEKLGVTLAQVRYIDWQLLEAYVQIANKDLLVEELNRRIDCFLAIVEDDKDYFYSGQNARDEVVHLGINLSHDATLTSLSGRVATQGKITGRARVVTNSQLNIDFEQGDILIAPMTTPDYVLLMQKAGAIITDEGGITSHAAVVSRELGVPCVVGTQHATKLFKDGDILEVDAFMGVVRKL